MYKLLTATGPDAETFLQGQLTQDLRLVNEERALAAAWCSPRGRVVATPRVLRIEGGYALVLPADHAEVVLKKISIYRLRAKVELELQHGVEAAAANTGDDLSRLRDHGLLPELKRHAVARSGRAFSVCLDGSVPVIEVFAPPEQMASLGLGRPLSEHQWRSAAIRACVLMIDGETSEKYTPHMLSLDLAGAISFDKGCYTGQEIVARTEHLGKSRRRLMRYECESSDVKPNDELLHEGKAVGAVVNASGEDVLAVVPQELHAQALLLHGLAARPASMTW